MMETETIAVDIEGNLKAPVYHHRQAPKGLPKLHFLAGLFGTRGAGKSTALLKFVRAYIKADCFDAIHLFCPTANLDPKYKALLTPLCHTDVENPPKKLTKPLLYIYESPDKDDIEFALESIKEAREDYKDYLRKKKVWDKLMKKGVDNLDDEEVLMLEEGEPTSMYSKEPTALMIFDDCAGNRDVYGNKRLDNAIIYHRHIGVSLIFVLQTLKGAGTSLSRQLRNNLSVVMLWACKDSQMKKDFSQTLAGKKSPQEIERMWDEATTEAHQFLFIDYSLVKGGFRIGFDKAFKNC